MRQREKSLVQTFIQPRTSGSLSSIIYKGLIRSFSFHLSYALYIVDSVILDFIHVLILTWLAGNFASFDNHRHNISGSFTFDVLLVKKLAVC